MTDLRPIHRSLPMQLLLTREAAMTHFRPMLRNHNLTEQQWRVIRVLAADGKLDASALAQRCFLLAPSLTRILQSLEQAGLIQRTVDPKDQRRSLLALTTAGRKKYRQVGPDSEDLYRDIERKFGKTRLTDLFKLLSELTESIGT